MCGIAGFAVSDGQALQPVIERLIPALANRGPDGSTWAVHHGVCLVQTRLAVIDLSSRVRYPMSNETGDLWLAFNGEIYNHRELRVRLETAGHCFATDCDAEVIVHGWEEWGEEVFVRLSGMFAIALVDEQSHELVLARDRLGIKPLVRTTSGRFAFGSDAIALVRSGLARGELDSEAIAEFLAFHYVPAPHTGVLGVEQVEPGTVVRRAADGTETVRRWAKRPFTGPPGDAVSVQELDAAVLRSVERHLKADVEVGVLLSGGLDSRLVLACAAELGARPRAFTASFPAHGDFDETAAAAAAARAFGASHETTTVETDFERSLAGVVAAFDQPFADASAVATLAVSDLARRAGVTVALTGTGGDDLWGGYARLRAHRLLRLVESLPRPLQGGMRGIRAARGAERRSASHLVRSYVARLAEAAGTDPTRQYLTLTAAHTTEAGRAFVRVDERAPDTVAERLGLFDSASATILRALQAFEARSYLPGDLLTKEDRATMAVSLEGRVPMLDLEILALAERAPDEQKIGMASGKRLLREVGERRLRRLPARGRKRGFAVPLHDLFDGPWRDEAASWFARIDGDLVDGPGVANALGHGTVPATDAWALAVLAGWERRLTDARAVASSVR